MGGASAAAGFSSQQPALRVSRILGEQHDAVDERPEHDGKGSSAGEPRNHEDAEQTDDQLRDRGLRVSRIEAAYSESHEQLEQTRGHLALVRVRNAERGMDTERCGRVRSTEAAWGAVRREAGGPADSRGVLEDIPAAPGADRSRVVHTDCADRREGTASDERPTLLPRREVTDLAFARSLWNEAIFPRSRRGMILRSMQGLRSGGSALLSAVFLAAIVACSPALPRARTSELEPTFERERQSRERVDKDRSCAELGLVFPGVSQFCLGKTAEGVALSGLAAAELGTIVAVGVSRDDGFEGLKHPAAGVPAIGLQNLWLYSYADAVFERQRAYQLRFVPMDTLGELAIAPFHPGVLAELDVWLGILATVPAGIGASLLIDGDLGYRRRG